MLTEAKNFVKCGFVALIIKNMSEIDGFSDVDRYNLNREGFEPDDFGEDEPGCAVVVIGERDAISQKIAGFMNGGLSEADAQKWAVGELEEKLLENTKIANLGKHLAAFGQVVAKRSGKFESGAQQVFCCEMAGIYKFRVTYSENGGAIRQMVVSIGNVEEVMSQLTDEEKDGLFSGIIGFKYQRAYDKCRFILRQLLSEKYGFKEVSAVDLK